MEEAGKESLFGGMEWTLAGLQSRVEDGTEKSIAEGARRLLAKPVVKKKPDFQ